MADGRYEKKIQKTFFFIVGEVENGKHEKKNSKNFFFIIGEVENGKYKKKKFKKLFFIVGEVADSRYEKKKFKKTFLLQVVVDTKKKSLNCFYCKCRVVIQKKNFQLFFYITNGYYMKKKKIKIFLS